MEKTEMMLYYEKETREPSTRFVGDGIHTFSQIEVWHYEYVRWLEKKAKRNISIDLALLKRSDQLHASVIEQIKYIENELKRLVIESDTNFEILDRANLKNEELSIG
ncbi:hypothetical protein [uncultured Sphaerochaeta sp.]|uniref:hypothetical protein n=1 Tax=uncultured Sphaerochaeta sp. TaxID=886478 RepID=UPI0029CA3537|nr:hypothetical protein [uncultured Sphaerochaeta sp.]